MTGKIPVERRHAISGHAWTVASECTNCQGNDATDRGDDPWAVARLRTGYVRLNPTQYHRGATFFVVQAFA